MQKALIIVILLVLNIFWSCENKKSEFDSSHENIKIRAYQETPIGGIGFVLLNDNRFRINLQGLFLPEYYYGKANIKSDSIFLNYSDNTINFDSVSLPRKLLVENQILKTDLGNWKYYLKIIDEK
ncbi:hypothetical protein ACG2LH_11555 [Zhouia sp. PK063]|uniref:hypothetical protein n=1 Tax=Zhouia sp. PK063 TaxID=3373602 RepID=UPI00379BB970